MPNILAPYNFTLHFRQSANTFRVWREGWAGDQFEVLSAVEYLDLCYTGITLIDHTGED